MKITSLCYVPERSPNGQYWLQRIADLRGDSFVPFVRVKKNRDDSKKPENMDRFPVMDIAPLVPGTIGIWDWDCGDNGYVTNTRFRGDITPVQFIGGPTKGGDETSVVAVAKWLRTEGVSRPVYASRVGIPITDGKMLVFDARLLVGDHLKLDIGVVSLDLFEFRLGWLEPATFQASDGKTVSLSYLRTAAPRRLERVCVYDQMDLVRNLLLKKLSWQTAKAASVKKADWKLAKDVLEKIDFGTLLDDVSKAVGCTMDAAKTIVDEFKKRLGSIDLTGSDAGILELAFENNDSFREKCIEEGGRRWKESHASSVKEAELKAKQTETELKLQLKAIENDLAQKKDKQSKLNEHIETLDRRNRELTTLIPKTEEAIQEKLESVRDNLPAAFAEFVLLRRVFGLNDPSPESKTSTGYNPGKPCDGPCEQFQDFANARKALSDNLKNAGFSKADLLSAWLCACAGSTGINLLFAGPRAESIATAFSVSVFGATPGVLDCAVADVASGEEAVSVDLSPVCIVRSPFEPKWVGRIPGLLERHSNNRRFVLCTPFAEDLAVEPESLLHGILPVLTEPFALGPATGAFKPGKIANGVGMRETTANLAFPDGVSARPWLLDTFKRVFSKAKSLQPVIDGMLQNYLVWLPLAAISGNATIVADAIKAEKMEFSSDSENVRSELLSFLS